MTNSYRINKQKRRTATRRNGIIMLVRSKASTYSFEKDMNLEA